MKYRRFLFCVLAAALAACSGTGSPSSGTAVLPSARTAAHPDLSIGRYIKHVVIVIQTNRSFDNLFATFPGANGATSGLMSNGQTVQLQESNLYNAKLYQNSHQAFTVDYDGGKMDGWNLVYVNQKPCPQCAYQYVNPAQIKPYWTMAQQYVLADAMFPTETSGDFSSHQDLIRGS